MNWLKSLLLGLCLVAFASQTLASNKIIPDHESYKDFLIEPYKPGAPTVVVFKDPYCGYCIRALKNLDRLSNYNVYMFWAGILGKSSEKKVSAILDCAAPVSQAVFDNVIARKSQVQCDKGLAQETLRLRQLNQEIVANYKPNSVPSYHFGGRKVYVSQLDRFKRNLQMNITPIQLQWERYAALKVGSQAHQGLGNAIVFLPQNSIKRPHVIKALEKDTNFSWYLVEQNCNKGSGCSETEKLSEELRLLMDVTGSDQTATVINGTVINPTRYHQYFSAGLATMLRSK